MYNRTPYNKTTYNRTTSIVFEWLATANAETDTSATLKIIRYLDGSAAAVATASGVFVRVLLPSALAEAEAGSVGDYIRTLFFSALAEAVATASGTGVSTYGSVTMVIEGVNMVAGDELIIDTEHMTVTLNGANIIDRVSDDSAFFKLQPGQGAAYAALGKIYVYEENWQEAINVLEPLTQNPYTYKLVEDFNWNFDDTHENNAESIFELLIEDVGGTDLWGDGENINSTQSNTRPKEYAAAEVGGWYEANPTQQIMDIFWKEKDKDGNFDYRARCSVAWDYEGCTYYQRPFREVFAQDKWKTYWILKYQNWKTQKDEPAPPKSFINERAIRYADVLLMLAEAYMNKGALDTSIGYINQIRRRANLNDYSGPITKEGVFEDLVHQRAIEFFVEGERFYDLRRWGLLEQTLKTCDDTRYKNYQTGKSGNINKFNYFPIPAKELDTNPLCTPSEGW